MISSVLPYIVVFLLALAMPADTDLGWHLKYGEHFAKTGRVLRDNIFSIEMSDYKWTSISWLTDFVTYIIYNSAGFLGLSIAGAMVSVLIVFFLDRAFKLSFWEKAFVLPLTYFITEPLLIVSFRGQQLSLLFTAILVYILSEFQRKKSGILYAAIPLFLLWVNMHGGFLLGLVIFFMFYFLHLVKQIFLKDKQSQLQILKYMPALIMSAGITLINPSGVEVYNEAFRHFGNPYQKYIVEWLALPAFSPLWWLLVFWGIFLAVNISLIVSKKKSTEYFEWIVISIILYILSHWMRRYAWTMYLVSMSVGSFYFLYIKPYRESFITRVIPILILGTIYAYSIFMQIPSKRLNNMTWERFCADYIKCSPTSAAFLLTNKPQGKFLSNYNWGGWLIWNYPGVKPSIDGRMHLWRDKNGNSAFATYYFYEQNIDDIHQSEYDVVYMTVEKPLYKRLTELENLGLWRAVYKDNLAGVFVRIKPPDEVTGTQDQ